MTDPLSSSRRDTQQEKEKSWFEIQIDKLWFQVLVFVISLLVYLLFGLFLWWVLDQYIKPQDSGEKKDLIQALGWIMAGLAGIVGVYFTWRNLKATQRNMENTHKSTQEQLNTAQAQLRVAQEGQITERFTKVIEQLGEEDDNDEPRLEIRIGGIYALERIAKHYQEHSPEDYGPIMEILTAYIRENAKWAPEQASGPTLKAHEVAAFQAPNWNWAASGVRGDIQAALNVLGRRQEKRMPLDLRRSDLAGADLAGADLSGADFARANLSGAMLIKADLSEARFEAADLSGAFLSGANLSGAIFTDAYLEGAMLVEVKLSGIEIEQVRGSLGLSRQEVGSTLTIPGTDLSAAGDLSQEQLEWTVGDSTTKQPSYRARPEGWSHYLGESEEQIKRIENHLQQQHEHHDQADKV
jgi:hypothetical protein